MLRVPIKILSLDATIITLSCSRLARTEAQQFMLVSWGSRDHKTFVNLLVFEKHCTSSRAHWARVAMMAVAVMVQRSKHAARIRLMYHTLLLLVQNKKVTCWTIWSLRLLFLNQQVPAIKPGFIGHTRRQRPPFDAPSDRSDRFHSQ